MTKRMGRAATPPPETGGRPGGGVTRLGAVVFALVTAALVCGATVTLAQTRGRTARPTKKKVDAGVPQSFEVDAAVEPMSGRPENAPAVRDAAARSAAPANKSGETGEVVEQKTLDGGAKVFRFGEVEIEGRLRSPQLVYFLRRVRAEFAAGDLGHRSFMRELSDTRRDPSF